MTHESKVMVQIDGKDSCVEGEGGGGIEVMTTHLTFRCGVCLGWLAC